jgi:DNA-binding transcriptional ArsR family regulator
VKKIKPFLHISDLSDEPVEYRIPDLLTMRGTVLISAYRKTGKTTLVLHLAAALTGRHTQFLGRPCTPLDGKLVYANFEMEQNMLRKYATDQNINGNFLVQDYRGAASHFELADEDWREEYANRLVDEGVKGLVVDPIHVLTVGAGADSNSNDDAREVLEWLSEVAAMASLTHLFVVDHTGHADKSRARGASGKEDWADILWNLQSSEGSDTRTLTVTGRGAQGGAIYAKNDGGQLEAGTRSGGDNPNNGVMIELGKSDGPMTVAELEAATGLSQASLSRSLAILEEQGSAIRTPSRTGRAQTWRTTRRV